jgi:internalin A
MSRFIVLSHEQIHEQICWRSGVMLAYCEGSEVYNIARIRADSEDRKISISVSGIEQTRRSHLSQIRAIFNKIHNSFADLAVTEYVPVPNHPDHPPLDYQELLGLEAMGDQTVTIGKLRLRLNLRQLLDGYDSYDSRQRQQRRKHNVDIEHPDSFGNINVNVYQSKRDTHQYGEGDNVAGDSIQGDKHS